MAKSLIAVAFLLLSFVAFTHAQCTQAQIDGCINTFVQNGGIRKDHNNVPILFNANDTANTFDNVCSARAAFQTCIDQFKDTCEGSIERSLQGLYNATEYMCSQPKEDYITNSPCLGQSDNQAFSKMCLEVHDTVLTHQNWCQKVNNYLACIAQGAETYCTAQSSTYQFSIIHKLLLNQANSYVCAIEPGEYNCKKELVGDCYLFFTRETGLSLDGEGVPIPFITNSKEPNFDNMCVQFGDLTKCLTYKSDCSDIGVQKTLEGVLGTFEYICDEKHEYLNHTQCLGSSDNKNDVLGCIVTVNTGLTDANWCSKVSTFYDCLGTSAKETCSAEAADYQTKIYMKMNEKQAERYTCGAGGLFRTTITVVTMVFITVIMTL